MKKIFKFNSLIICFLLMFSLTSCKKIEIAEEFKEPIDVVTTTMKLDHWVYFANADDSGYLVYENNDYFTFELDSKYVSTSTKIILKSKPVKEERIIEVKLSIYDDSSYEELKATGTVKFLLHGKNYYIEDIFAEAGKHYGATSDWKRDGNIVFYKGSSKTTIGKKDYYYNSEVRFDTTTNVLDYYHSSKVSDGNSSEYSKTEKSYNANTKQVTDKLTNHSVYTNRMYDHDVDVVEVLNSIIYYIRHVDYYLKEVGKLQLLSGLAEYKAEELYIVNYSYISKDNSYFAEENSIVFSDATYIENLVLPLLFRGMEVIRLNKSILNDNEKITCNTLTIPVEYTYFENESFKGVEAKKVVNKNPEADGSAFKGSYIEEIVLDFNEVVDSWNINYCDSVKKIDYNNKVKTLTVDDIEYCANLEEVILTGVKVIKGGYYSGVLYNCPKLKTITLSNDLKSISDAAFYGCDSLETIVFLGTMAEWNSVEKTSGKKFYPEKNWYYNCGIKNVVCTDGTIEVNS